MKQFHVCILTNKRHGVLYTGITSDLVKRIHEHKGKFVEGFSKRYNLDKLVYYETLSDPENAIVREKRIKEWKREWKLKLIEDFNPEWRDLYGDICA